MQQLSTPAQIPTFLSTILEGSESCHSSEGLASHVSGSSLDVASPRDDRQSSSFSFKRALRNIANRLACGARASSSAQQSNPERSESPRSVESRSSFGDLTESNASDVSGRELSISIDDHVALLQQFYVEAYGKDDPELAEAGLTHSGKAFDSFLKIALAMVPNPQAAEANAASLYLLFNTDRPTLQVPVLQQAFQNDRNYLHNTYGDQFTGEQIEHAIKDNVRLWIKANLIDCEPQKQQLLKQQFLDRVSLDLTGRPSQDQESVELFSTPDEASVDFDDLGFDDLDSEGSFAGMTVAHERLGSEGSSAGMKVTHESLASRGSLNSRASDNVSEANTRSASFDSMSFGSSASSLPLPESRQTSPFLSSDPRNVPANLLAFDTNPEMYSFWRLLSDAHGPVENLGQEEKNIASFNILLGQDSSVTSIPRLNQAFQVDRNALHQDLRRSGFDPDQIDIAITNQIQDWLKEQFNGPIDDGNHGSTNQFSSLVNRRLKENEEGLDAETMYPILEASSSSSQSGRSSLDNVESASSLSSNGWGEQTLYISNPNNLSRLAELLPKANPARLIGSRSSEGSRLSELAKNFSWFAKPLSAPLRLRHAANDTPGVKVDVIEKDSAPPALAVKFTPGKEHARVNMEADLQLKAAFSPHTFLQGDKSLNSMFLAQLDNSGIDKHLYHQAIRQGANQSAGGFRLAAQAHGGLMARTLPFMGPKKSLEQKAVSRLDGRGGKRLSALADHPKQFSKASDKAFLTYIASQQALWNKIKPYFVAGDRLFVVPDSNEPIHFNLLHQIGFAQKNLNTNQLVQMGKLVMSAVGADVVRSSLSDVDIGMLYRQNGMQEDQPMPLNANQFRAALGPGRINRGGEKTYGTLGSQVIDLMARLNSKPGTPASLKEHQMMGNLLTLMVKRQARLETPVAIQKTKVSRQADPFKETLIVNLRHKLVNELRGEEPADRLIRDDESMFMVCEAATKAVNKAFAAIAKAGIVGNVPFLNKLKSELRSDAGFYEAMNDGLADDIPNLTSERRPGYLNEWMVFLADTAEWIFTRSVHVDSTNRAGQGGNRQSEIQPA